VAASKRKSKKPAKREKPAPKPRKSGAMQARQAAYRTLILDAAERVFATKGFDGAKIKDVADEAGLALGTVYVLFPSKLEVFAAVHALRGRALLEQSGAAVLAVQAQEEPFAALCAMQRAAFAFYAQHPAYLRMHLYSGTAWAAPQLDVEEERHVFELGIVALVSLFERAAARGELVDERPETCARLYVASMQVLLAEWQAEGFKSAAEEMAARFEAHMMRSFARKGADASRGAKSTGTKTARRSA
jgi:AcrR family transcriptional regulator